MLTRYNQKHLQYIEHILDPIAACHKNQALFDVGK